MDIKTKAFLRELSDLLCKYDATLESTDWIDISIDGALRLALNTDLTWQELDLVLEENK